MEEKQQTSESSVHSCGKCGMGYGCCHGCRRFWWLKVVLGLVILAVVFCVGIKVGEFKTYMRGGFGYPRHGYLGRYPMMNGSTGVFQQNYPMIPNAASSTTTTTPKK